MLIIPAIDLKDGKCVRLKQGVMDDSTAVIFIEALYDVYDLLGNAIVTQDSPNHCSFHHVKCLLEENKTYIRLYFRCVCCFGLGALAW